MTNKQNGAYYTPNYLAEFILNYISKDFTNIKHLSILEPSVGDGSFVNAFNSTTFSRRVRSFSFTGIEKVKSELKKTINLALSQRKKNTKYSFIRTDFLNFQKKVRKRFFLIVGNPPYIKKNLLTKTQINISEEIFRQANISNIKVRNIWPSFLIKCSELLNDEGILAFVLPSELLQVNFADKIRNYLQENFERIEIFTFNNLLFECKGQDTIILFAFKVHLNPGLYYTNIKDTKQLINESFVLRQNQTIVETNTKWTHHSLNHDELTLIYNIGNRLKVIENFCNSKPGIVTAANHFFIVDKDIEKEYGLSKYCKPIIQKSILVNGSVVFTKEDFEKLIRDGLPTKLLLLSDSHIDSFSNKVSDYLKIGINQKIQERYKCIKRNYWYSIPNIPLISEGFIFKRSHLYPKLLKNEARVLTTDSAYSIYMKENYKMESLIYSFYNSLTLLYAEILGRYYGGGVLELTPNEFKHLPIPYVNISEVNFEGFAKDFKMKHSIEEILQKNDLVILGENLGLSLEEIRKINIIYEKLKNKRLRK
jgi:adenine-specific DNA-methyltransferase